MAPTLCTSSFLLLLFSPLVYFPRAQLGALAEIQATDPCEDLSAQIGLSAFNYGRYMARTSSFRKCFNGFPLDKKKARSILDTVSKTLNYAYVYRTIAKNYTSPYIISRVDAKKELQKINNTAWKTERAFHDALFNLTNRYNDAHLVYYSTCFHSKTLSLTALQLISYVKSDGKLGIKIIPNMKSIPSFLLSATELVMGTSVAQYVNSDVISIEGVPAVDYLRRYADKHVGSTQDLAGRFNRLFTRDQYITLSEDKNGLPVGNSIRYQIPGDFSFRVLLPYKDTIDVVVKRPGSETEESLSVPWFTLYQGQPFRNATHFYALNCMVSQRPTSEESLTMSRPYDLRRTTHPFLNSIVPQLSFKRHLVKKLETDNELSSICVYDGFIKAYLLPGNKTGIVLVPGFYISDKSSWFKDFVTAFITLKGMGCSNYILEMSSNEGGFLILGLSIMEVMFPSKNPYYPGRILGSGLFSKMVESAQSKIESVFWYGQFSDVNNKPFDSPDGFYFPVENLTYGGIPDNYSRPFKDRQLDYEPIENFPKLSSKNLIVLTNGLCYSTCGLVVTLLKELCGVKVVSIGGLPKRPMAFGGSVGGVTLDLSYLLKELQYLGLENLKSAPRPFPYPASLYFTWRMTFGKGKPKVPLDFVFQPADVHIPYNQTTVLNLVAVWSKVATYFKQ